MTGSTPDQVGMPSSDPSLPKLGDGPQESFESLMVQWQDHVIRLCRYFLGYGEDALDAAQEVFIRLYRSLPSVDPGRPLGPWLYRVTVNVCRTHASRRRRYLRLKSILWLKSADPPSWNPVEAAAEQADERKIMKAALQALTPNERIAVVLRDIEGLSTAEVAQTMGTSETTVRSHISRARVKIREYRSRYLRRPS